MCMPKAPKIPDPIAPPPAPPPPTKTAKKVEEVKKKPGQTTSRGTAALTVRRPSTNVNSAGSGANVSY